MDARLAREVMRTGVPRTDNPVVTGVARLSAVVIVASALTATPAQNQSARIAFIDGGDVWEWTSEAPSPQQRTDTGGLVEDFRYSPGGVYLALGIRLGVTAERPVTSIVVVETSTKRTMGEVEPNDLWLDIDTWLGHTLLYHASAAMEVVGFFAFDPARHQRRTLDPEAAWSARSSDMTADGTFLVYVDDVGVGPSYRQRLHLVDRRAGADVIGPSMRSVMAPAVSNDGTRVAFVEVSGTGISARDRTWVYQREDKSLRLQSDEEVGPKNHGTGLSWSPDDRFIMANFGDTVHVHEFEGHSPPRTFRGTDACWASGRSVAVTVPGLAGVETIDVVSGARHTLVPRGTHPQCVWPRVAP